MGREGLELGLKPAVWSELCLSSPTRQFGHLTGGSHLATYGMLSGPWRCEGPSPRPQAGSPGWGADLATPQEVPEWMTQASGP